MAKTIAPLGVAELTKIIMPGRHACGNRLYMELSPEGSRRWLVRAVINGKPTWRKLGRVDTTQWGDSLGVTGSKASKRSSLD